MDGSNTRGIVIVTVAGGGSAARAGSDISEGIGAEESVVRYVFDQQSADCGRAVARCLGNVVDLALSLLAASIMTD